MPTTEQFENAGIMTCVIGTVLLVVGFVTGSSIALGIAIGCCIYSVVCGIVVIRRKTPQ